MNEDRKLSSHIYVQCRVIIARGVGIISSAGIGATLVQIPFFGRVQGPDIRQELLHSYLEGRRLSGINRWDESWTPRLQKDIERHWMNKIEENAFDEGSEKEKFYVLSMFPYPSGNLHMGHVRVYTIGDTFARYHRIKGRNVIHPMGWDAFGLPAENAAIERNLNPDDWTQKNIEQMKSLMERMNFSFDWNREFATCDSDYYKWTQFLFSKLYQNGLVYRKEAFVNWDPVDETVLADEQVNEEGRSWRSGAVVEKKLLEQWFIRTTRYCQSLKDGLRDPVLQDWGKIIKVQESWIGDANGTTLNFEVVENVSNLKHKFMTVWMLEPEFVHMIKYIAVDPESVWNSKTVVSGVLPYRVKNPLTGDVLPVYATNFLQFPNGRDNYAAMPELVESDKLYAESVNLRYVMSGEMIATREELEEHRRVVCAEARRMNVGGYPVSSSFRDWLISRQRYWGTPIPIIHCEKCGPQLVPEEELPVKPPEASVIRKGENTLSKAKEWLNAKCPNCGGPGLRETDTMDTFVDSSWYYLRFLDPDNVNAPFGVEAAKKYMPVDLYVGGKEHATLHLYYARFMSHFLHSAGLLEFREPFKRLLPQGFVRGKTFRLESTGEYLKPEDVEMAGDTAVHKLTGEAVLVSWEKMSKSKFNGVEPDELLNKFGSDTTRMTILTDVSPLEERDWSGDSFRGIINWQIRVWYLLGRFIQVRNQSGLPPPDREALKKMDDAFFDSRNYAVDMVGHSLEVTLNLNLAIKKMMSLTNDLRSVSDAGIMHSAQFERALAALIIMMAPVAPCFASELWCGFANAPNRIDRAKEFDWGKPVFLQAWPKLDSNYVSKFSKKTGTLKSDYDKERKKRKSKKNVGAPRTVALEC